MYDRENLLNKMNVLIEYLSTEAVMYVSEFLSGEKNSN